MFIHLGFFMRVYVQGNTTAVVSTEDLIEEKTRQNIFKVCKDRSYP